MPRAGHTQECYLPTTTKVPALHYSHYMKYYSVNAAKGKMRTC